MLVGLMAEIERLSTRLDELEEGMSMVEGWLLDVHET